jgi:predicted transporter
MDLSIVLWIGGMLFSLGIFAFKVGFGLGFGGVRWKGVFLTLSLYLVLFVFIAMLSERLIKILEPVLRKGPYLHALMAMGMIVWGLHLLRIQKTDNITQTVKNKDLKTLNSSLLLLIPCPVCLTAITFSTWAALNVFKFPAYLVGVGLGIVFIVLSLAFYFSLKLFTRHSSLVTPKVGLGLSLIAIGFYFIASLFLPAKIEEAKSVYFSFVDKGCIIDFNNTIGALLIFFIALLIGYFSHVRKEVKK